jgi:hypothetical protein
MAETKILERWFFLQNSYLLVFHGGFDDDTWAVYLNNE